MINAGHLIRRDHGNDDELRKIWCDKVCFFPSLNTKTKQSCLYQLGLKFLLFYYNYIFPYISLCCWNPDYFSIFLLKISYYQIIFLLTLYIVHNEWSLHRPPSNNSIQKLLEISWSLTNYIYWSISILELFHYVSKQCLMFLYILN